MKKADDLDLTSVLYLAHALPMLRERSEEAAALVEAAILECAVSLSGHGDGTGEHLNLAAFLAHAVDDIATITPVGAGLLRRAIGALVQTRRDAATQMSVLH